MVLTAVDGVRVSDTPYDRRVAGILQPLVEDDVVLGAWCRVGVGRASAVERHDRSRWTRAFDGRRRGCGGMRRPVRDQPRVVVHGDTAEGVEQDEVGARIAIGIARREARRISRPRAPPPTSPAATATSI